MAMAVSGYQFGQKVAFLTTAPWLVTPNDWAGQALVTWAVYAEGLDLSYDPERDQATIRAHLADLEALRKAPGKPHLREGITSGRKGDSV